ncbi:MAG TPA: ABC transporter substrate-binding protein, partial [Opitutae bacterium]|nr:ABC transporter substrate-binding protein [Opitutae bacterium]
GSYTQKSYQDNLTKLQDWLKTQLEYEAIGEPYAVYWNSPFVPGFLKRSEVHIPVRIKPVPLKR